MQVGKSLTKQQSSTCEKSREQVWSRHVLLSYQERASGIDSGDWLGGEPQNGRVMKVVNSAGRSAKWILGILGRVLLFFHVVFGWGYDGDLIQPRGADWAPLVMVHE